VQAKCELLFLHSNDDERVPAEKSEDVAPECVSAEFFAVDGPRHRNTARDPAVIERIGAFG